VNWVNAVVQGILVGGLYALYATGLSIIFGVMRLVNLAHGDLAVAFAFFSSTVVLATGWYPLVTLVVLLPAAFLCGVVLQKVAFDRLVGVDPAYQVVGTFGLAVVIANFLLQRYSATPRALAIGQLGTRAIKITGSVAVGWFPLLRFLVAVGVLALLAAFLGGTKTGRALRATSDDPEAARLMGINTRSIYAVATGIAVASVALAGVFNGAQTNFSPGDGALLLIYAFEAVIIGGLGSLWGTLAGGVILGVSQTVGAEIDPGWKQLAGHVVFLVVLVVRPTGLFGAKDSG
jgi:branched-chain amino acid transport system permease protein